MPGADGYAAVAKLLHWLTALLVLGMIGVGLWMVGLPPRSASTPQDYATAWHHILNTAELAGPHGLRTVEPSYPHYLQQYRYDRATGLP